MSRARPLILAAHGAGVASRADRQVHLLARTLSRRLGGTAVRPAFHLGTPSVPEALREAPGGAVILPLLTSEGYFSSRLEGVIAAGGQSGCTHTLLPPLGVADALREAACARLSRLLCHTRPKPDHLLLVAHGTDRHSGSGASARQLATLLMERCGLPTTVAFLDQEPTIREVVASLRGGTRLVVFPFLLGGGRHAAADVFTAVESARCPSSSDGVVVEWIPPLLDWEELPDVVVDHLERTRGDSTIVVGARGSALSHRQVDLFREVARSHGVSLRFTPIATRGDLDRTTPIDSLGGHDAFTAQINAALRLGTVDLAVHSLKDLPLLPEAGVVTAAVLERGNPGEVLVARHGATLNDLPAGARIGVSCQRRARQILRLRSGVRCVAIRGDVPSRVAAVQQGHVDAVVLAAAGLERLGLQHLISQRFTLDELLPAPGQGAIAIQCRTDSPHRKWLERCDHLPTRNAIQAELSVAQAFPDPGGVAAVATPLPGVGVRLQVRWLTTDGSWRETVEEGTRPRAVGRRAAARLLGTRSGLTGGVR